MAARISRARAPVCFAFGCNVCVALGFVASSSDALEGAAAVDSNTAGATLASAAVPRASVSALFRGGAAPGVVLSAASAPGGLSVAEVPADAGWVRAVAAKHRTPNNPFGSALELHWSAESRAELTLRASTPAFTSAVKHQQLAANGYLVFDLMLLATGDGSAGNTSGAPALEVGARCAEPAPRACGVAQRLDGAALGPAGVWRTWRIPLSSLGALPSRHSHGVLPAFVLRNAGPSALAVRVADVRWEAYPEGLTFAESLARDLVAELSLADKIGQLAQLVHRAGADGDPLDPPEAAALGVGSVFGDSGAPPHDASGNLLPDTPEVWAAFLRSYQQAALESGNGIPILFGMDAVHGLALVPGATVFPHQIGLGASGDLALAEQIGHVTAREAAALGFRLTFGPTIAVARDERWGRTYESFSELPSVVGPFGAALTRGFQNMAARDGAQLSQLDAILACAKHFGGDGAGTFAPQPFCTVEPCGTGYSVDRGDNQLELQTLIDLHLQPYLDALAAGAGFVMSADSRWRGEVITGSSALLGGVLKQRFGFQGVVVTDYASWSLLDPDPGVAMRKTLNAGNDLVMLPTQADFGFLAQAVLEGLDSGELPLARVDDAVRRLLQKKLELGLFDVPFAPAPLLAEVGSAPHRALARRAVRESLVLLKNKPRVAGGAPLLPLGATAHVYVAGKAADDLGIQSGGWTDTWQGTLGNALPGTTVLGAIGEEASGGLVFSPDATADFAGSDVGVVVIGEYPYAEFCGDVLGTTYFCEFARVSPPGLVRAIPDAPFPIGLPPPQTLGLGTSSFDYRTPLLGVPDFPLPVQVDPVSDAEVAARVCAALPCVVVLISGRPLFIEPVLERADALVAAWLPGTEGGGIADVLFARDGADFRGHLEHTWPATPRDPSDPTRASSQPELDYVPQNEFVAGQGNLSAVLFPRGYGLRYR